MSVDLQTLARQVWLDVETYKAPEPHPDALGSSLPAEWFYQGVDEMRAALVHDDLAISL